MNSYSIWEKRSFLAPADFLIIGAGITGISTAFHIKKKKPLAVVRVIDQSPFPGGASTKNAGFACIGSPSELLEDLKNSDTDNVFNLVERRWKGLQLLRDLLEDENIGYENLPAHELFLGDDLELYQHCLERLEDFNKNLQQITGLVKSFERISIEAQPWTFHGFQEALRCSAEGQLDTGKMMRSWLDLAREAGVEFCFGVQTQEINSRQIETNYGPVRFGQLLLCSNGLTKNLIPNLDVQAARAQILVTGPIKDLTWSGPFHYDRGYFYFRNLGDRVLFGGGRQLDFEGESTTVETTSDLIQNALESHLRMHILPDRDFEIEHRWAGIMGVGLKKKPIIKQLDKNIWCAVRLGGMGVALGSLLGKELAEISL